MSGIKGRSGVYKHKPISDNTKILISKALTGKKKSEESIKKRSGKNNYAWKGDDVGYFQLHRWIESKLGNSKYCECCKSSQKKKYEWANKDHKYKRKIEDWIRLCTSCHRQYDYKNNLSNIGSKWGSIKNKLN